MRDAGNMKVFIVGDHRTGTGPANVTKEYIQRIPAKVSYQKVVSKAARVPELFLKIAGCDVVLFSGYSKQNLLGLRIAKAFKKPTAYLMHGCVEYENGINKVPDPKMNRVERATLAGADRIFAVSERFASWLREHYPEQAEKIEIVANGIAQEGAEPQQKVEIFRDAPALGPRCSRYISSWKTSLSNEPAESPKNLIFSSAPAFTDTQIAEERNFGEASPEQFNKKTSIFSIGGGMPRKMIRYICKAVKILRDEGIDATLTVVGAEGADTDEINSYDFVRNLGLVDSNVVRELFKESDLFIQNSCFETFGLAPVEALSNGCSVLLSKEVGALDLIEKAADGDIINNYNDPVEIAEKIKNILENPNAERLLSGIDFDKYSWNARGEALCLKLQEMLKK